MRALVFNRWILLFLRIIIASVFIYAGAVKLGDPLSFADSIATFQVLPAAGINIVAIALPPFEIALGILLLAGWQLRSASFSIIVLCAVFALAMTQGMVRGLEIDCGCFGSGQPSTWKVWFSLARDMTLLGGAIILYISSMRQAGYGQLSDQVETVGSVDRV